MFRDDAPSSYRILGECKGMSLTELKIGLINVLVEGDYQFEQEIPLGMGAIGAFLRTNGYEVEFKAAQSELFTHFGNLQYEYFLETMRLVEHDCSDEELNASANEFLGETYGHYLLVYSKLYEDFLSKIKAKNFSLTGLLFKAFHSAIDESDREEFTV